MSHRMPLINDWVKLNIDVVLNSLTKIIGSIRAFRWRKGEQLRGFKAKLTVKISKNG